VDGADTRQKIDLPHRCRANPIAVVDVQTNKVAARITAGTLPGGLAIATLD